MRQDRSPRPRGESTRWRGDGERAVLPRTARVQWKQEANAEVESGYKQCQQAGTCLRELGHLDWGREEKLARGSLVQAGRALPDPAASSDRGTDRK